MNLNEISYMSNMELSSHIAILLVLPFLLFCTFPNAAQEHGIANFELSSGRTSENFLLETWRSNTVLQANAVNIRLFTDLMKKLAFMDQPSPGINNARASEMKQATVVACDAFEKLIQQLLFEQSNSMTKNIMADNSRRNAIKQASSQSAILFANLMEQLAAPFSRGSQTGAIHSGWARAMMETADVIAAAFTDLMTQLADMPPPSTEYFNIRASEVMRTTHVITGAFTILMDELALSQSTGIAETYTADDSRGRAIIAATDQYTEAFMNFLRLYVA